MLKFNNTHLFTGYLKQLLSSTKLPTYRVYTKEHKLYKDKYGVESPEIIETIPTSTYTYKNHIRYIPYIKDGNIMEYVFHEDAFSTNAENATGSASWETIDNYYQDKNSLNNVKSLRITNNVYDSYTHEYLGNYLRFLRDYYQLDLMSMYNCFSNRVCQNLYLECEHLSSETAVKRHFLFNASDKRYKIYMIPVKLFKEYTIAIDCNTEVEMCCGFYGKYQDSTTDISGIISHDTYKRYAQLHFNQPILYAPLKNLNTFLSKDSLVEVATRENDLKLFIKLPAHNASSITVLEGNYLGYNDRFTHHVITAKNDRVIDTLTEVKNHIITNMLDEETEEIITEEAYISTRQFKPITNLQLLTANTGTSYPFSDRLIEYLMDNAITHLDSVADNITRTQTVVGGATNNTVRTITDGVWDERLRPVLYHFMQTNSKVSQDINHDVLGYVDKDIEQLFNAPIWNTDTGKYETVSIANVDLYPDIYLATKTESQL